MTADQAAPPRPAPSADPEAPDLRRGGILDLSRCRVCGKQRSRGCGCEGVQEALLRESLEWDSASASPTTPRCPVTGQALTLRRGKFQPVTAGELVPAPPYTEETGWPVPIGPPPARAPRPHSPEAADLYWRFVPMALALARRVSLPNWDREDWEQEALCLLLRFAYRFVESGRQGDPAGYLYGRVRNGLWRRTQGRVTYEQGGSMSGEVMKGHGGRRERVSIDPDDHREPAAAGVVAEERSRRASLRRLTARLDEGWATWRDAALVLFTRLGWGPSRIAAECPTAFASPDAVTSRKRRLSLRCATVF